ncbi:MAG: hypothetical protein Kow00120_17400 [Anaerolineae bacterium]
MRRLLYAIMALCLLVPGFAGASLAGAQATEPPLYMSLDGDIWSWDGVALTQLTTWGYNERPVIAPTGRYFAYNSVARFVVESGRFVAGDQPSNIWVGDTLTGDFFRAADQPAGAGFGPGGEINGILRSTPAWSPDASRLVWSEVVVPGYTYRIAGYDFTTDTYSVIVPSLPQPFADGGAVALDVWWGGPGIATQIFRYTEAGPRNEVWIYSGSGALVAAFELGNVSASVFGWVRYASRDHVGVLLYDSGQVGLVDPYTGAFQIAGGWPELAAGSLSAAYVAPAFTGAGGEGAQFPWYGVYADGVQAQALGVDYAPAFQHKVALAPGTHGVAYIDDGALGGVYIWRNGQAVLIPGTQGRTSAFESGLAWGYTAWRIRGDVGGTPACPGAPPSRLTAGGRGRVVPGTLPNRLRVAPTTTSRILARIPDSGVFDVVSGPTCAEGFAWWLVAYQGVTGWTAEGEAGVYWLEPAP